MVDYLSSKQMVWVQFPLPAKKGKKAKKFEIFHFSNFIEKGR